VRSVLAVIFFFTWGRTKREERRLCQQNRPQRRIKKKGRSSVPVYLISEVGMHGAPATHSIVATTRHGIHPRHPTARNLLQGFKLDAIVQTNKGKFAAV
jgi:hypothetical protein